MSGTTQHFPLSLPHTSDLATAESNRQLLDALNQTGKRSATSQESSPPAPYELDPASSFFPLLPYGFVDSVDTTGWQCQVGSKGTGSITRVFDQQTQCDVIELLSSPTNPLINYTVQGTSSLSQTNGGKSLNGSMAIPIASNIVASASQGIEQSSFNHSIVDREKTAAAVKRRHAAELLDTAVEFPSKSQFIGTALPVLNIQMKNLNKYVSFSIEIEDTAGKLHRFSVSNSCTVVRIRLDSADLPLTLTQGWNKLTLNLADLTRACFNSTYASCHRVRIQASCRLRRVFFSDEIYPDFALAELSEDFQPAVL